MRPTEHPIPNHPTRARAEGSRKGEAAAATKGAAAAAATAATAACWGENF